MNEIKDNEKKETIKLPTKGSLIYQIMHNNQSGNKKISLFKKMNKYFVVPLFRLNILPIFGMGFFFVLIRTKGRKSGKIRYTPLEYRKFDGKYYIFAARGKKAHWFKNILAYPDEFMVKHHFFWKKPRFKIVNDINTKIKIFKEYTMKYPKAAKEFFGYDKRKHSMKELDFSQLAEHVQIIEMDF